MQPIKDILVAVKSVGGPPPHEVSLLCRHFADCGGSARIISTGSKEEIASFAEEHHDGAVVVLGGDGTLVGVVRTLLEQCHPLPVLGMNYGRVGFLAEAPAGDIGDVAPAVAHALTEGRCSAAPRTALIWEIFRHGRKTAGGYAVNDVVLARRGVMARVCTLSVSVGGSALGTFRADGVIVSTPAGSSGYTYSAGGFLVHPDIHAVSMTAVAPFLSHFPNMVLPVGTELSLCAEEGSAQVGLTVDGQTGEELLIGDVLAVRGVADAFTMLVPDAKSYFRRLKRCGFTFEPGGQT